MKKLLIIIAVALCLNSFGQISLEKKYPTPNAPNIKGMYMKVINLCHAGMKYQFFDWNEQVLYLYNLNHSLYKKINIPKISSRTSWKNGGVRYVSEDLFDNDSTNIEYVLSTQNDTSYAGNVKIYREDNTLLFNGDSLILIK